jgi:hypothetical protein
MNVSVAPGFPEKYKHGLGQATGFRILPYRKQDRYRRDKIPLELKTVTLENDFLRATFLPDFGARLISLEDKKNGAELLYRNSVFQPANLAIRNAWFSGGIEWNVGQYGHAFSTCSPVFCSAQKDRNGEDFLRIYDYERCKGFFWQIDFHLPSGSRFLAAHARIQNLDNAEKSMYYWTNAAIAQTAGSRVFSATRDVIYIDPRSTPGTRRFGFGQLPELEPLPGVDATYPARSTYSNEYFFACDGKIRPWEAAIGADGKGFFEASTDRLKYRKMFSWGSLDGGRRWAEFLSSPGESYYEIQAGLAPTQLHGIVMPGRSSWDWTQVFGPIAVDPAAAHDNDWNRARTYVGCEVDRLMTVQKIYELHARCHATAATPCGELLHAGSGWGALECERRRKSGEQPVPPAFRFPLTSIGSEQKPWFSLLHEGEFPDKRPEDIPWSFLVQSEWEDLLEQSLAKTADDRLWNVLLHLGVMAMERGDDDKAVDLWRRSLAVRESAWAYRNLACARLRAADIPGAIDLYIKAESAPGFRADRAIAEESMTLMVEHEYLDEAQSLYSRLDETWRSRSDTIAIAYGRLCVKKGNIAGAEETLKRDFANIREGETPLSDIWFGIEALKESRNRDVQIDGKILERIRATRVPPFELDFRMQ